MIASIDQPFVISLNAPFGMGKTCFINQWRADLKNKGFKTAYFNAWETDFSSNALAAFMSALKRELSSCKETKATRTVLKKISILAAKSGGFLRHYAGPMVARALVRRYLDNEDIETIKSLGFEEGELADLASNLASEALAAQEAAEASMVDFRLELEKIVAHVTSDEEDSKKRKLIIFVDELDRCRPNYSIEVLECIKHLFCVNNIVFILSVDEAQLRKTVSTVYGPDMDGPGYFSRFFDWRLSLPDPDYWAFARFLVGSSGVSKAPVMYGMEPDDQESKDNATTFSSWFSECAKAFKLPPRQQIRIFTEVNLVLRSLDQGNPPLLDVMAFVSILKSQFPAECRSICLKYEDRKRAYEAIKDDLLKITPPKNGGVGLGMSQYVEAWSFGVGQQRELANKIDKIDLWNIPEDNRDRKRQLEIEGHLLSTVLNYLNTARVILGTHDKSMLATVYARLERASVLLR